jgi:hypothetical protein
MQGNHDSLKEFNAVRTNEQYVEYLVPSSRFNEFMTIAGQNSVEVTLVETKRKDLEAFFLDIVEKGKA